MCLITASIRAFTELTVVIAVLLSCGLLVPAVVSAESRTHELRPCSTGWDHCPVHMPTTARDDGLWLQSAPPTQAPRLTAGKNLTTTPIADDREVYVITSRIRGWVPKLGILFHTSIVICPKGVPPIIYENGESVTNWRHCSIYGTQTNRRGFFRERKRIGVRATKICGMSATEVERRMRSHSQLNIPLLHDCRHHAIGVTGMSGILFRHKLALFLR